MKFKPKIFVRSLCKIAEQTVVTYMFNFCSKRTNWPLAIIEPQHDKTNKVTVHPAKTQIRLGGLIRVFAVWSMDS